MPEPVFSAEDRLTGDSLPAELVGKSPAEIVAFYAQREATLRTELSRPPVEREREPERQPISNEAFWNKPEENARKVAQEEFARMSAGAQKALFSAAKVACRDAHSEDVKSGVWLELEAQLLTLVGNLQPFQQVDPGMWEMAYTQVKGQNTDRLVKRASESTTRSSSELPSASSIVTEVPKELELGVWPQAKADKMLEGLNLSKDSYLKASHRVEHGSFPMTFDNVRRKVS